MRNKRPPPKEKKIKPHYWVFCEGKTEEAYICFLRSEYRVPMEIIPKIAGCDISKRYINSYKKGKFTHEKDRDFLIYDAGIQDVLDKLNKIDSAVLIVSNPAIELWYLLHFKSQTASISVEECIRQLNNRNRNQYKKGVIDNLLVNKLKEKRDDACSRSKRLILYDNPSTNMHILIETLETVKK